MRQFLLASPGAALLVAASCASAPAPQRVAPGPQVASAPVIPPPPANPLLAPWSGEHGGMPPFDQVQVAHFKPALEAAMDAQRKEVAAITANPALATFDNTLGAMENAGREFNRVETLYGIWKTSMKGPEFQAVEREMEPRLAAFEDELVQNAPLSSASRLSTPPGRRRA